MMHLVSSVMGLIFALYRRKRSAHNSDAKLNVSSRSQSAPAYLMCEFIFLNIA